MFVAYWAVATIGFFVLRQYKVAHHSWLAFAATAGLFTVIAWGSVGLVPRATEVQHVTVLDHIAMPGGSADQQQYQRATSFVSVYLPGYGFTRLTLGGEGEHRNLLLPWTPPGEQPAPFPNTNTFRVDVARNMADFSIPSRATTTQLYANWMGGVDGKWGGLLRVDPNNPVRVVTHADGSEASLAGSILSDLPGTLTDVTVMWIRNQRVPTRSYARTAGRDEPWVNPNQSGSMMNVGYSWKVLSPDGLASGSRFDLSALRPDGNSSMIARLGATYVDPYLQRSQQMMPDNVDLDVRDQRRFMEMMTIFHHLPPPAYIASRSGPSATGSDSVTFHRELARELDLSPWFTRPCVIVLGYLEESALPIPLRIGDNDDPPTSTGLTMVRWVYPLPLDQHIAFPQQTLESADPDSEG
jgi:hypothetical protein